VLGCSNEAENADGTCRMHGETGEATTPRPRWECKVMKF
jgi:hypothetical protein